jgi:hypothetical protein
MAAAGRPFNATAGADAFHAFGSFNGEPQAMPWMWWACASLVPPYGYGWSSRSTSATAAFSDATAI